MRICLINNLYEPFVRGGAERVTEAIARELQTAGHDVSIVSTRPYGAKIRPGGNRYYIPSLFYHLSKMPVFFRLFWHVADLFDVVNFIRLTRFLKAKRIEVAMTHNLKGIGYLAPLAIRRLGIRHVHTLHDMQLLHPSGLMYYGSESAVDGFFARAYAFASRCLFGSPAIVVSPSRWLLELHKNREFFKNSEKAVMNNPVASGVIGEARSAGPRLSFLYVGQLETHKGVDILLEANRILREGFGNRYELVIVGEGNLRQAVQTDDNVVFAGRQDRVGVADHMKRADCLVVPSVCYENSPTVIYEAIMADLPVIASDLGGTRELLAEDDRLVFRPNAADLAGKMAWAIENREELKTAFSEIKRDSFLDARLYVGRLMGMIDRI